jgi:hypothetical protein
MVLTSFDRVSGARVVQQPVFAPFGPAKPTAYPLNRASSVKHFLLLLLAEILNLLINIQLK